MRTRVLTLGWLSLLAAFAMPAVPLQACQFVQSSGPQASGELPHVHVTAQSSIRLTFEFDIPELQIENPEIVRAVCITPNAINLTGVRPGVTTITFSDPNKNLHTITVDVAIDTRKLEMTLKQYFTDSSVKVTPLQTGVLLTGYVARAEDVNNVLAVTRDFFPSNVVNQLRVDGSQVVATEVRVYEVSRTKLRRLGIDWAGFGENGRIVSGFSDLMSNINDLTTVQGNFTASVFNDPNGLTAVLNALEQKNVARLMTQPTLVSQNGRPAELLSGGEVPIQVAGGLGTNSIEFRAFGTRLDVVPIVHGQGDLTLEVRAEVSEIAPELAGDTGVPGFRVRRVNTSAPMRSGQTLVLAGVYSEASAGESRGAPGLVNKPLIGAFFRNVSNTSNETELVFILTPRTVAPVDGCALPTALPGRSTTDPSSFELFNNGHIEVPRCDQGCPELNPYLGADSPRILPQSPAHTEPAPAIQPIPPQVPVPAGSVPGDGAVPHAATSQFEPVPPGVRPMRAPSVTVEDAVTVQSGDGSYFQNADTSPTSGTGSRFGYPGSSDGSGSALPAAVGSSRTSSNR